MLDNFITEKQNRQCMETASIIMRLKVVYASILSGGIREGGITVAVPINTELPDLAIT